MGCLTGDYPMQTEGAELFNRHTHGLDHRAAIGADKERERGRLVRDRVKGGRLAGNESEREKKKTNRSAKMFEIKLNSVEKCQLLWRTVSFAHHDDRWALSLGGLSACAAPPYRSGRQDRNGSNRMRGTRKRRGWFERIYWKKRKREIRTRTRAGAITGLIPLGSTNRCVCMIWTGEHNSLQMFSMVGTGRFGRKNWKRTRTTITNALSPKSSDRRVRRQFLFSPLASPIEKLFF